MSLTSTPSCDIIKREDKMNHMCALLKEMDIIKQRFQPSDTGHLRGAVRVLEDRVTELRKELSVND